jgi:exopolysaccharide biosynthesis protein
VTTNANDPRDLRGLAMSGGTVLSTFEPAYPSALITQDNGVSFATTLPSTLSNVWTAVSGSGFVLLDGVAQLQGCTNKFCNRPNPRTALGVSRDERYLYMMVIDGRQPGWSMGATLFETGQWLARFGAWTGLNLDGGGSSAIAHMTNGGAVLMNRPSDGKQRVNGNHLGVFARPLETPNSSNEPRPSIPLSDE